MLRELTLSSYGRIIFVVICFWVEFACWWKVFVPTPLACALLMIVGPDLRHSGQHSWTKNICMDQVVHKICAIDNSDSIFMSEYFLLENLCKQSLIIVESVSPGCFQYIARNKVNN